MLVDLRTYLSHSFDVEIRGHIHMHMFEIIWASASGMRAIIMQDNSYNRTLQLSVWLCIRSELSKVSFWCDSTFKPNS